MAASYSLLSTEKEPAFQSKLNLITRVIRCVLLVHSLRIKKAFKRREHAFTSYAVPSDLFSSMTVFSFNFRSQEEQLSLAEVKDQEELEQAP